MMGNFKEKFVSYIREKIGFNEAFRTLLSQGKQTVDGRPTQTYRQVEIVFACVEKLIDGILGLPLMLSTSDDKIVESGPIYDMLFNSERFTWQRFVFDWVGHWALSRDVFIIFGRAVGLDDDEFIVINGAQMHAVTADGRIDAKDGKLVAWEFRGTNGQRVRFGLNEVHQTKNFNPYDKFHGTGPLHACNNAIDFCHAVTQRAAATLRNGSEPGLIGVVPAGVNLTKEEKDYLAANIDARHQGAGKVKRTMIATGGMTFESIAMKMVDMQAAEISEKEACKIAVAFKVPPQMVGLKTEAQYSHGPMMRDFVFNSIIPLASMFAGELTEAVCQRSYPSESQAVEYSCSKIYTGKYCDIPIHKSSYRTARKKAIQATQSIFAWFDVDQHPTVQEAKREVAEKVLKFKDSGVPLDQIVDAYDLPFDTSRIPWAKTWLVSPALVKAEDIIAGDLDSVAGEDIPEDEDADKSNVDTIIKTIAELLAGNTNTVSDSDIEKASRVWTRYAASWQPLEKEFTSAMRTYFRRQKNEMIKRLKAALNDDKAERTKADADDIVARIVFDLKSENGKIKAIHHTFFQRGQKFGAAQMITETVGTDGDDLVTAVNQTVQQRAARRSLAISARKIQNTNEATQNRIADTLKKGLDKGEGLTELTKRISDDFSFSPARAKRVARTSVSGSVSSGRFEGLKAVKAEKKGWLSARNEAVRNSHKSADARYSTDGIALNEYFTVGSASLMFPGDPAGDVGEIANCRCMVIAIKAAGKIFTLAFYDEHVAFLGYDEFKTLFNED